MQRTEVETYAVRLSPKPGDRRGHESQAGTLRVPIMSGIVAHRRLGTPCLARLTRWRHTRGVLVDRGLELLTEPQCRKLLASEDLGRVGVSLGALPAIYPVNYKMVGEDVVFRIGAGVKQRAALEGTVVGFEVDRIDTSRSAGWSVMVVGVARQITQDEYPDLAGISVSPWAAGERTHFVLIHPEMISGRRIVTDL